MFDTENAQLFALSRQVFGEGLRLQVVDPKKLRLLKENARYFKRETFRQLRDNIKADRRLSSMPLCYLHAGEDGQIEVLSGNHRVKASIEAGLEQIMVLVITEQLSTSRRIAIQLSHNSLVGEDDQSILANLWAQVEDLEDKLYSGLDSEALAELKEVELVNFSTPQVAARTVSFMFTEAEAGRMDELLEELAAEVFGSARVYVSPGKDFERFMELIQGVKGSEKIRDNSLALVRLMEVGEAHLAKHIEMEAESHEQANSN